MADVKQIQQMIPLITRELPLVRMSASWVFGVDVLDFDFFVQVVSIEQSSATLWVLETCLIVGLLPLKIFLITASLSSNTYNRAS